MCDPSQTVEREKWKQACTQGNQSNMADPAADSEREDDDSEKSWFMCQTDTDVAELHISSSATPVQEHLEVEVELQLGDAEPLTFTLYGHGNHSSLDLLPPEEQEEEEDEKKGDEGCKAFYCCLPVPPNSSDSANQSHCLLWLANQTVSSATAKEKLPWKRTQRDEWRCMLRVVWLALLFVVLLTVVTTVLGQLYSERRSHKKPTESPAYSLTAQASYDGKKSRGIVIPNGQDVLLHQSRRWSELAPIEEADSEEGIETLLDGNFNYDYTANLHHRGHPPTLYLTEEQPQECSTEMDLK